MRPSERASCHATPRGEPALNKMASSIAVTAEPLLLRHFTADNIMGARATCAGLRLKSPFSVPRLYFFSLLPLPPFRRHLIATSAMASCW